MNIQITDRPRRATMYVEMGDDCLHTLVTLEEDGLLPTSFTLNRRTLRELHTFLGRMLDDMDIVDDGYTVQTDYTNPRDPLPF